MLVGVAEVVFEEEQEASQRNHENNILDPGLGLGPQAMAPTVTSGYGV